MKLGFPNSTKLRKIKDIAFNNTVLSWGMQDRHKNQRKSELINKRNWIKRCLLAFTAIFILMNIVAIFHSYKFTHFSNKKIEKTKDPQNLTFQEKIKILIFGVSNPRPENEVYPSKNFEIIYLKSNKAIECWSIKSENAKGTVILFHGFSASKSSMLDKADVFLELGYNALLVDFMGSSGSEGNQTTVGYWEAEQVVACYNYLKDKGEENVILYGTSMGSVAIMKAISDSSLKPNSIIIECPFGSMYKTVCARFDAMNIPSFPMAGLLVLWGGIQNGFWAFGHNPTEYAKKNNCPTLLFYGEKDEKVSRDEIDEIFENIKGKKKLITFQEAGHENYLNKYKNEWKQHIVQFLENL